VAEHKQPSRDHVDIVSKDPAKTRAFLEKTFGWKFSSMEMMGGYHMHGPMEGATTGSLGVRGLMGPENPGTISFVTVPDIEATLKFAQSAGAKIIVPKTEVPGFGWSAGFHPPGGVVQGLFQHQAMK
jgi:predicted enzyme related to lactoylglutathione lyase